jgi:hypothetical protein
LAGEEVIRKLERRVVAGRGVEMVRRWGVVGYGDGGYGRAEIGVVCGILT